MKYEPEKISKNIRRKDSFKRILFILIYILLIPVILFSLFLTMIELGKNSNISNFMDYEFYTVVSESMSPKLNKNDIIIIKKGVSIDKIKEHNIITFKNKYGEIITHRVVGFSKEDERKVLITKGDKNELEDSDVVRQDMIIGRMVYKLPGYMLIFKSKAFFSTAVLVLIIIMMINIRSSKKKMRRKIERQKHEQKPIWE